MLFIYIKFFYVGVPQLLVIFVVVVADVLRCAKQDLWHTMKSMKSGDLQNLHNIGVEGCNCHFHVHHLPKPVYLTPFLERFFGSLPAEADHMDVGWCVLFSISDLQVWSESIHIQLVQHSMSSCHVKEVSALIYLLHLWRQNLYRQLAVSISCNITTIHGKAV